jgi:rod shape determining protein RodA
VNPAQKSFRLLLRMNWVTTAVMLALLVIGVFFVFSSCYVNESLPVRSLYKKQMVWALVGLVCYAGFAVLDYRHLRRWAWWGYWLAIALLILVLIIGKRIYGARRWLMLFGDAGIGVQPSELAKLALVLALSRKLSRPGENLGYVGTFLGILAVTAVPVALIMRQPDLGTAMVFLPIAFVMMFVAGVPLRSLGTLVLIGVLVVSVVLGAAVLPEKLGASEEVQSRALKAVGLSPYHRERILVFLDPDRDPLGAGWNRRQSVIAVGSGGKWGKGFLKGTQNILGFLPRSVAPTDFIYSVIAEEMGFSGSAVVLVLFGFIVFGGMQAAAAAKDRLGRMLCVGVVTMIFCHVCINLAMTVGLMPITGLPLPLLSYGGSFTVVMMSALGMVQSVWIRSRQEAVSYEQGRLWQTGAAEGYR